MQQPFRAFVSYSHDDQALFAATRTALRNVGLDVTSDTELRPGPGFTEQIQTSIAHAHVFVPILTPRSHERGWVHQEIGFAVALRVPYVPMCVGKLPDGMIAMSHAMNVEVDLSNLDREVRKVDFEDLINRAGSAEGPPATVADEPEERSQTIARYSTEAFSARGGCHVRGSGGFSSFSLPDEDPTHLKWKAAYGDRPRGPYAYRLLRDEIVSLKRHATKSGVSLVLDLSRNLDSYRGQGVTRTRLCLLREFLNSIPASAETVRIAVVGEHPADLELAIGDWVFARSRAARIDTGVVHTTFTTHAPTISRRIAQFDARLNSLLKSQNVLPEDSHAHALSMLDQRINELPPHPAWPCS